MLRSLADRRRHRTHADTVAEAGCVRPVVAPRLASSLRVGRVWCDLPHHPLR
ncbi:MAG: hypothetical protein IPG76_04325 [Acidobacteria bacterium]|nr:hypothetical protein [Acidobacteriota bacterium]